MNLHADGDNGEYDGGGCGGGGGDEGGGVGGDGDYDGLKGEWNYATGQKLQFSSETLQ